MKRKNWPLIKTKTNKYIYSVCVKSSARVFDVFPFRASMDDSDEDEYKLNAEQSLHTFALAHLENPKGVYFKKQLEKERAIAIDNPFVLVVAKAMHAFRKKKNFYTILHKLANNNLVWQAIAADTTKYTMDAANNPFGAAGANAKILNPENFPTGGEPLLLWLKQLMLNLMGVKLDFTHGNHGISPLYDIPQDTSVLNLQQTGASGDVKRMLIDTMNALCARFAREHGLTFAVFKGGANKNIGTTLERMEQNRALLPQWNEYMHSGGVAEEKAAKSKKMKKKKRERREPKTTVVVDSVPDAELISEEAIGMGVYGEKGPGVMIPIEIIQRMEKLLRKTETPPTFEIPTSYDKNLHTTDLIVPEHMPATTSVDAMRASIHGDIVPHDEGDVADCIEVSIKEFFQERNTITGGVIMAPSSMVTEVAIDAMAGSGDLISRKEKEYEFESGDEDDHEVIFHMENVGENDVPIFEEDPDHDEEVAFNPDLVTAHPLHYSVKTILGDHNPAPPHNHIVHKDSAVCSKIAKEFVRAWRNAKQRLYKTHGLRHFPIKHAFFHDGAICHRCYQLVKQHHEQYHLKTHHIVVHKVLPYPRKRLREAKEEKGYTKKELYQNTKAKAEKMTSYYKSHSSTEIKSRLRKKRGKKEE